MNEIGLARRLNAWYALLQLSAYWTQRSTSMLIHNATVVCFDDENRVLNDGAVRYGGSTVDAVGASAELLSRYP